MDVNTSIPRRRLLGGLLGSSCALLLRDARRRVGAQSIDSEVAACLEEGDTKCAVEVYRTAFESSRFDDLARENLYIALIVHGIRSLDSGLLAVAQEALEEAKELLPYDTRHTYLDDACSTFQQSIGVYRMTRRAFNEVDQVQFESSYIEMEGFFGEKVSALAMTQKEPGFFNYFSIPKRTSGRGSEDIAFRFLVHPFSTRGHIILGLGLQPDTSMVALTLSSYELPSIGWFDGGSSSRGWESLDTGDWINFNPNSWHVVEVWTLGQTLRFFFDYVEIARTTSLDYVPGGCFFGVGLPQFESSTFSAAFMDISFYSIE